MRIWLHDNKAWIIGHLKDMISDLEDDHHSFPMFKRLLESKMKMWESEFKMKDMFKERGA